jgi:CubicO group peptidase (beta-lactamase class C family)
LIIYPSAQTDTSSRTAMAGSKRHGTIRCVARHLLQQPAATPVAADDADPLLTTEQRAAIASDGEAAVAELILAAMERQGVPAVSAAIVKRGAVVWARAFGQANVERRVPATTDTIFALASVTKTVTGVALMQLHEAGLVDLDADVSTYLPFAVSHPLHPARPITLRALMSHTASINDTTVWMASGAMGSGLGYAGGDPTVNLTYACREYLCPGGVYHSVENYHEWQPTQGYSYSNVGIALVGLVVQTVSGEDFYEYCYSHVLRPLGMTESFWRYSDMQAARFPMERLAMPYGYTHPWGQPSLEDQVSTSFIDQHFPTLRQYGIDAVASMQFETRNHL